MVVHTFELVNGDWIYQGKRGVCSAIIKGELENLEEFEDLEVHATVNDKKLTMMYNDKHLDEQGKRTAQKATAKVAHIFVVTHAQVKRKGANIIRYKYTFERTGGQ